MKRIAFAISLLAFSCVGNAQLLGNFGTAYWVMAPGGPCNPYADAMQIDVTTGRVLACSATAGNRFVVVGGDTIPYPGAGIPSSTGSEWGASYSTSGTGNRILLSNSPEITGNSGMPVQGNTGTLFIGSGYPAPVVGKFIIGDGSGWHLDLANRISSTDTSVVRFFDNGSAIFNGTITAPTFAGTATGLSGNIAESQVTNLVSDLALKAPLQDPHFSGEVHIGGSLFLDNVTPGSIPYVSPTFSLDPSGIDVGVTSPNTVTFGPPVAIPSRLNISANTPATSSNNYSSPLAVFSGNYWNGTQSQPDYWQWQAVLGTGTNPTSTFTLQKGGGTSGIYSVSIPFPVTLGSCTLTNGNSCGGSGSGTVSPGVTGNIPWYAASGTTVGPNPRLTDSGTELIYTGTDIKVSAITINANANSNVRLFGPDSTNGGSPIQHLLPYEGNIPVEIGTFTSNDGICSNGSQYFDCGIDLFSGGVVADAQVAAGSGATATIKGNRHAGVVTLVMGTSPPSSGELVRVTFTPAYSSAAYCPISPYAETITKEGISKTTTGTQLPGSFSIYANGTALSANTSYAWIYSCGN